MITEKFDYQFISRDSENGKRLYLTPSGEKLASVTTILDKTKPAESREALNKWRKRVGVEQAKKITSEAANVGTYMHGYLEDWVKYDHYERKDNLIHRVAGRMADAIIENISPHLDEIWGTEVPLYYPGLYAGTTDLVGVWKQKPAIMDFKQTNKPKKREWIEDYFLQGTAYGLAHNELFDTNIETVAIFMCSREAEFQLFELDAQEFKYYSEKWAQRVGSFYELDK